MPWKAIAGDVGGALIGGAFSAREASKNRAFQERMAKNQYQYAAQDLEKAGLNRILAIGSPAGTPSGSAASHAGPTPGSTGIAAASAKQQIRVGQAQEDLLEEQANAAHADARLKHAEADWQEWMKGKAVEGGGTLEKGLEATGTWLGTKAGQVHEALEKGRQRISTGSRFIKEKAGDTLRYWRNKK